MRNPWSRRKFLSVAGASLAISARGAWGAESRLAENRDPLALGLQSYTLREFDVEKAIDLAKELGFAHVEFTRKHISADTPVETVEAVKRKMAGLGLRISAQGVNPLTNDHAANRKVFELAKRMGNRNVTADPTEDAFDSLDKLVAEYNLRVAIHNHGPGARYDKIADVLKAIQGHDKRIGACADLGHYIRSAEDPVKAIMLFGDRLYGIHLKDFAEPTKNAKGVILGKGHLDLVGVYKALKKVNFPADGALSLEYEENAKNPLPDVKECVAAAREARAKAIE
ncbi:MAG TPA: sugar phosphate isomerase/epimerase family protein [Pirellulales bacterium]|jgi:sugar phosphate isomerase/epimerase|nr:sugar phosphate isomerase/epimerase family protein [Pirellulales bacterium]